MTQRKMIMTLAIALGVIAGSAETFAQPVLTFTRIVNNWPTIELYFKAACDGQPAYPTSKQFFEISENGIPVDEFTLWCPDPRMRCAISVALVFDGSASMPAASTQGAKDAGNEFVDLMDGIIDEAAVIWFSNAVYVEQPMTTNKTNLHAAINNLPATGGASLWDGVYVGLQELILTGQNPCRGVIVVTDGSFTGGSHTPDEIISLANRNRIRVFTVGVGSTIPAQLETVALLTGGKYYQSPTGSQLVAIYQEISTILFAGFIECMMTYQAKCMDGGVRVVDLTLKDYCHGGSDTKTRTYRAPKDTSTYSPLVFEIGNESAFPMAEVIVPVRLVTPISPKSNFYPATFSIEYDGNALQFNQVQRPAGTLLESIPIDVQDMNQRITISTQQRFLMEGNGTLCYLSFTTQQNNDSLTTPVEFNHWTFEAGCFQPILRDGEVFIYNGMSMHVLPTGDHQLCDGDSLVLEAIDGFTDYRWSNGATGRTLVVRQPGQYFVSGEISGRRDTSRIINVTRLLQPTPGLSVKRDTTICLGDSVVIIADGGYTKYDWSDGTSTQQIVITKTGNYFVRVQNSNGCWGYSQNVSVTVDPVPAPDIDGRADICGSSSVLAYTSPKAPGYFNTWTVTNGQIIGPNHGDTVMVQWENGLAWGKVHLSQSNPVTGCTAEDNLNVQGKAINTTLSIKRDTTICRGTPLQLAALFGYDGYLWSTGAITREIDIVDEGDYWVTLTLDSCTAISDTIHVTVLEGITTLLSGETAVCQGDIEMYTSTQYPGAGYVWDVDGGTVVQGQSTSAASIEWTTPGEGTVIIMTHMGSCLAADTIKVNVDSNAPPAVSFEDTVLCEGETVELSAPAGYVSYQWSTGETSQSIQVGQVGTYSVTVESANGCTAVSDPLNITVLPLPPKPLIVQHGNVLTCTIIGASYIWYLDGNVIPNEEDQTLVISEDGRYSVTVVDANGCGSTSDPTTYTGTGHFAPGLATRFELSPNPSNGEFSLSLDFEKPTTFQYRLVNVAGEVVYRAHSERPVVSYHRTINFDDARAGVYFFILESSGAFTFRKLIIQ